MDEDKSGILSYWNMKESGKDTRPFQITEFPLYSDSRITGEIRNTGNSYEFLNLVPFDNSSRLANESIMVRMSWFVDGEGTYGVKTDHSKYHGGWVTDELAALSSLRLGVRFKAGSVVRVFGGHCTDDLGCPNAARNEIPEVRFGYGKPILPSVVKQVSIEKLQTINELQVLKSQQFVALVRSARQYQKSLWVAETEPELAWLMLVSALETAANEWQAQELSSVEMMKIAKPDLSESILAQGNEKLLETISTEIAPTLKATAKFMKFCINFMPEPPEKRPTEYAQVNWSKSNLKKILNIIYKYRSIALHAGTPFPTPLCRPPDVTNKAEVVSEKGCLGLAAHTMGGSWKSEDLPMTMNTFSYFVNEVLNSWWDSMVQQEV